MLKNEIKSENLPNAEFGKYYFAIAGQAKSFWPETDLKGIVLLPKAQNFHNDKPRYMNIFLCDC